MDFLPELSTGKEAALRWNGAYVAFGPGHRETLVLHRQLVQDAFGISLPAWVHVHHKHGAHDNRISSLEFLDRARHGDEHGRVGGRRGGVGVSKRERNALPKEREPGLLGRGAVPPASGQAGEKAAKGGRFAAAVHGDEDARLVKHRIY